MHADDPALFSPIEWAGDHLRLLDQTRLPAEEVWLECREVDQVADAIRRLCVRGAPAIGVAAAWGLVVGLRTPREGQGLAARLEEVHAQLAGTRPTAVNLRWALDRGREIASGVAESDAVATLERWAAELQAADVETNRRIGDHGAGLFAPGEKVLTHCNAGALATAGYGTAVGVVTSAHRDGKVERVWVDETRPLLQGARLTAWELQRLEIPFDIVTDSSVGALMSRGLVDRVVVGADRIAANGDTANKIGTYTVAVLANRHGVPFHVAAPLSTIDRSLASGSEIPIEERDDDEVTAVGGRAVAPQGATARNFAFDVTPHELVASIVTEAGVLEPPFEASIADAFRRQG